MRLWVMAGTVVALVAVFSAIPFAWIAGPILAQQDWHADSLQGRIWHGRAIGLKGSTGSIQQVDMQWKPDGLLRGTPVQISVRAPGVRAHGQVGPGKASRAKARLELSELPLSDMRVAGMQGQLGLDIDAMQWDRNGCLLAKGNVETDVLARNANRLQWRGPMLSGPLACDAGKLVVHLIGANADARINADISITVSGRYEARIRVQTAKPELRQILPAYGFTPTHSEFLLHEEGKLMR